MTKSEEIVAAVRAMPEEQRPHVLDMLMEVVYHSEAAIDEAWRRELERREVALATGEAKLLDGDAVIAGIRRRFSGPDHATGEWSPRIVKTAEEIFEAANALPEEQRLLLAHHLFDSLHEMDEHFERACVQEVRRRCDEIDRGEVELIPADEVFEEARKILASQ